ncbi:MAG: lipid-A-disaccharide synthase [Gammaproteobacteria bacterium]|nr:lipid-A-disaccharide synthase [Gammaproteobacteria bacterium]
MKPPHVMILAGEASGDAHAAEFVEQLRQLRPDIELSGMGSSEMTRAGVDVFFDSSIIAVIGLVEVLRHWSDIKRAMTIVKKRLDDTLPDLLVLVDYPEFNLKMARHARELGIPVLFYISPQVWAWRPKRIHKIGRLIDHMAVIFRFEKQYYEAAGIPVSFVGHPLVNKVKTSASADTIRARLEIPTQARVVGLFPGSRRSEVTRLLPVMFASAKRMHEQDTELKFVLPVASTLDFDDISRQARDSGADVRVTRDGIYDVISCCDAIATCSGTVTLEIALLKVPMCILYRMSSLSYQIMSRLLTIPHIGLVNIVAREAVVKEFLQADANPQKVSRELFDLLENREYRARIDSGLERVRKNLGSGNGARNMAELVLAMSTNRQDRLSNK